jgi:16S rRNA (uracil1498-N3)-methyltransferase
MHRFYLPQPAFSADETQLSPEESHHAAIVLRLEAGQKITVFDGSGFEAPATILEIARGAVKIALGTRQKTPGLPCAITLAQAVPKGKNMELIVQKAVELGAKRIVPIISDRTISRWTAEEAQDKTRKWQAVAIEACKQCGQNVLPEVCLPMGMKEFLEKTPLAELPLIASLQPDARHLKQWLAELPGERKPSSVTILVGPEGDFTPAETGAAKSAGYRPVTLGPIILRTETAAIYCLSVLAHECF